MKKILLAITILLFSFTESFSQIKDSTKISCGNESYQKFVEEQMPELYKIYKAKANSITNILGPPVDTTTIYTIPVVFRIYHLGEAVGVGSNLSETNIKMAINSMNQAFRGTGRFEGLTVDNKIQFVLASRKPDGTATNGIERIDGRVVAGYQANGLTSYDVSAFNALGLQWGSNYYRICVYHTITFAGGFSSYNANFQHVYNFGSDDPGALLAHEAGHSLNLAHTFEGDGDNQYCPVNNNPDVDGDAISDTDPHKKATSYDSLAINPCTGRSFGKVIYNIMSYGYKTHFTQKQKEKMRFSLVNFQPHLINSPGLLPPNNDLTALTSACTVANTSGLTSYSDIEFKLNNLLYSNFNSSNKYTDYTKFYPTELLIAGQSYTFSVQPRSSNSRIIRLYIDYNNDGDFNDANESPVNFNGNIPVTGSLFNINVPTNSVTNVNLRMRFIYYYGTGGDACNLSNASGTYGGASDFSIKVIPNCGTIIPPTVASINVPNGQSATLQATNCTGTVKWYDIDQNYIQSGSSLIVNNIQRVHQYYASCTLGTCESTQRTKASITPTYFITSNSIASQCTGTATPISFTHNFPADTYFTLIIRKNGKILPDTYLGRSVNTNSFNFTPPYEMTYGTDYSFQVISGLTKSNISSNITIGNLSYSGSGFKTNPSFVDIDNDYLGGYDYLCTGSSKSLLGKIIKITINNVVTEITEGLTFQWKKDGINVGTNQNPITVSQSGTYQLEAKQGGCTLVSNNLYLNFTSSPYFSTNQYENFICDGSNTNLVSRYSTNTSSYQWRKNGVAISGATNRTFSVNTTGQYSVSVVDGTCLGTSNSANIQFSSALRPQVYSPDTTLCGGNSVSLFVTQEFKNNSSFQWQKDGVDIINATDYSIYPNTAGTYRAIVRQGNCNSSTKNITVINSSKSQKPIMSLPDNLIMCAGSPNGIYFNNTYSVLYKDNVPIFTGYYYNPTQTGYYKIKTYPTTDVCSNESDSVLISIGTNLIPIIKLYNGYDNLSSKTIPSTCGQDYVLLNFDPPQGTFTYQWQKNGLDINYATYQSLAVYNTNIGDYRLRVTNGSCTAYSNVISVTQNNGNLARIVADDNNLGCTNRLAKLELFNGYSAGIQWFKDGVLIPNENSTKIYVASQGNYTVSFNSGLGCSGTTPGLILNSNFVAKPLTSPLSIIIGQSTTLTAFGCSGSVSWYDAAFNGNLLGVGSSYTTPSLTSSKFYFASCSVSGCSSNRSATLVTVNPCTVMYSVLSGNWNNNSIWSCGRTPTITDNVTISSGHTVTIPSGQTGFVYNLTNNGMLVNAGNLKIRIP